MFPRVIGVRHIKDYELEIEFSDGKIGRLDFRQRVVGRGGVFSPLESIDFFSKVAIDSEAGTLRWPNQVDFCPDVLYAEICGTTVAEADSGLEVA